MTVGGSMALAGCGLFQSKTGPDGASPRSDSTFRATIGQNPAKTSVYVSHGLTKFLESAFATSINENASGRLQRFLREDGLWTDGLFVGSDIHYTWLDEITVTPTAVSVTIRDDAQWSDGHDITGKDVALGPLLLHLQQGRPPYYATDEKDDPAFIYGAFDDFDVSDRLVTYRNSDGFFEQFWDWTIRTEFGNSHSSTVRSTLPTHIQPYDDFADAVIETVHRAQRREIDPWKKVKPWKKDVADPHRKSLAKKYLGNAKYVAKFSKADNVLATGAWDPAEFRGSEAFVFEKNPHHRNADAINFETFILEYTSDARRKRAGLKADRLDYGSAVTPPSVVESFPDDISQLRIPGGIYTGNELGLNFDHPALGNRQVRKAIMYALDHEAIADNIHQSTAKPVETPGGDCWDATDYVTQSWIDENLTTYDRDRPKAATLMREAGYTRDGDQWIDANGLPFTLSLPTQSDTPRWEPTVASQLSQFGIKTSVTTMNEGQFSSRRNNGEFDIWPTVLKSTTNLAPATLFPWYYAPMKGRIYGITGVYPYEQLKTGNYGRSGLPSPRTEQRWRTFTVKAPPIGQPNGPLQEFHPSALSLFLFTNPPEAEFRRRVKTGLWLANWFLPTIPINKTSQQHFIDDTHWQWPMETPSWKTFTDGGPRLSEGIFASGELRADPENPE
jgi:ABC-type transport system substrate-binding protein